MIQALELQYQAMHVPEMAMPLQAQAVLLWGLGGFAAVLAVIAIRIGLRDRDWTPLVLLIAGTFASLTTEALSDLLTHFTHAQVGAITIQTSYARVIPWHVFFISSLYFGAWYMFAYSRMLSGTFGGSFLWKAYLFSVVGAYFFEAIPIAQGLWAYFEPQPLWFWRGTLPPNFACMNAFSIVFGMVAMDKLRSVPKPWTLPVMLIAGPCAPIMGHIGAGQPYYLTMNSGLSQFWIDMGGVATIITCTLGVWVLNQIGYAKISASSRT